MAAPPHHELWYNHSELDLFYLMPKLMPTIFTINGYRFSFYSSDCAERMHVHVTKGGNQAKFWIEPTIELFRTFGYRNKQLNEIEGIIAEHVDFIRAAWLDFCGDE